MGRFAMGFIFGAVLGLIFAPILFPDGLASAIQHWADNIRGAMPMH